MRPAPQNKPASTSSTPRGRRPATTHDTVERVSLTVFAQRGFDNTTMDDVATALGIGRRTLFRYFPSKNDMVWGNFDLVLERLRLLLAATPADVPVMSALSAAIVESNRYEPDRLAELRIRMTLITSVPALQAHAALRYRSWREVVAEFVAERRGQPADALIPQTVGFLALGVSMAAFSRWVTHPEEALDTNLVEAFGTLDGSVPV